MVKEKVEVENFHIFNYNDTFAVLVTSAWRCRNGYCSTHCLVLFFLGTTDDAANKRKAITNIFKELTEISIQTANYIKIVRPACNSSNVHNLFNIESVCKCFNVYIVRIFHVYILFIKHRKIFSPILHIHVGIIKTLSTKLIFKLHIAAQYVCFKFKSN